MPETTLPKSNNETADLLLKNDKISSHWKTRFNNLFNGYASPTITPERVAVFEIMRTQDRDKRKDDIKKRNEKIAAIDEQIAGLEKSITGAEETATDQIGVADKEIERLNGLIQVQEGLKKQATAAKDNEVAGFNEQISALYVQRSELTSNYDLDMNRLKGFTYIVYDMQTQQVVEKSGKIWDKEKLYNPNEYVADANKVMKEWGAKYGMPDFKVNQMIVIAFEWVDGMTAARNDAPEYRKATHKLSDVKMIPATAKAFDKSTGHLVLLCGEDERGVKRVLPGNDCGVNLGYSGSLAYWAQDSVRDYAVNVGRNTDVPGAFFVRCVQNAKANTQ